MSDGPAEPHVWMIGIDSWVIQDGNYPDFVTGQRTDFALEFASRSGLRRLEGAHEIGARWVADSRYEVTAQIVHDEPNAQVLDFGLLAYHFIGIEDPAHESQVGAWVTGEIILGVDPFFYCDELVREDGFPPLIYGWTVQEVLQWEGKSQGFVRVEHTDAWADVDKSPTYLLRCHREPLPRSAVRTLGRPGGGSGAV